MKGLGGDVNESNKQQVHDVFMDEVSIKMDLLKITVDGVVITMPIRSWHKIATWEAEKYGRIYSKEIKK